MEKMLEFYEAKCKELLLLREDLKKINGQSNAIYYAMRHQVQSVGDIDMSYVKALLETEGKRITLKANELNTKYCLFSAFLLDFEKFIPEKYHMVEGICNFTINIIE